MDKDAGNCKRRNTCQTRGNKYIRSGDSYSARSRTGEYDESSRAGDGT